MITCLVSIKAWAPLSGCGVVTPAVALKRTHEPLEGILNNPSDQLPVGPLRNGIECKKSCVGARRYKEAGGGLSLFF